MWGGGGGGRWGTAFAIALWNCGPLDIWHTDRLASLKRWIKTKCFPLVSDVLKTGHAIAYLSGPMATLFNKYFVPYPFLPSHTGLKLKFYISLSAYCTCVHLSSSPYGWSWRLFLHWHDNSGCAQSKVIITVVCEQKINRLILIFFWIGYTLY